MNTAAIIQARMNSQRLPNKVLLSFCGKPLLWHIVKRIGHAKNIDAIAVATSTRSTDDPIERWCVQNAIACFRGSEDDVLSRFYHAALQLHADNIVRITADDPFKDPDIIDYAVALLKKGKHDFVCNNNPPSFPEGLDTEVFTFQALEKAHRHATTAFEREHVTQYFYRHPELFRQFNIVSTTNLAHLRWTLDTEDDYVFVDVVYRALYREGSIFFMTEVLDFLNTYPEIATINQNVKRSHMYQSCHECN